MDGLHRAIGVKPNKEKRHWHFSLPNALTMGELAEADSPVDYLCGERAAHGGPAPSLQTMQDCIAQQVSLGPANEAG